VNLDGEWWRDPDKLRWAYEQHGSIENIEIALGRPSRKTLYVWWRKHGLPPLTIGAVSQGKPGVVQEVTELDLLREKVRQYERHLSEQRKSDVLTESVVERILAAVPTCSPKYQPPRVSGKKPDAQEALLLLGDFHASEVVSPGEVLGMNEYSWTIMVDRMRMVAESVESHVNHAGFPVKRLHIALLGDMLSGDIHDELAITNDRPTAQAVVDLSAELASMIEGFVPLFPSITITGVPGNHPRYSKKMPAKQAYNNADWMMYKMLEHRLSRYKSIKCDFPMSAFSRVTIAERWKLLLFHGDGIRSSMPGVPWGGLSRRVASLMEQFGAAQVAVDYIACGHFHTANALDGVQVETFMNGSLKGVDEYSVKQFGGGRRAKQRLIFFHEKRGATSLAWIDLQDTIPSAERRAA